jgi:hypothetical protein
MGAAGVYQVTLDGDQLSAKLSGQPTFPIYPQSPTMFFYKIVNAQITFMPGPDGVAASLVLHQNGLDIPMTRVDQTTAEALTRQTEAKQSQLTPSPGTEAALRRLINGALSGQPDYAHMSPALADAVRERAPMLEAAAQKMGPIQSVEFLGVDAYGNDVYNVRQQNGVTHWLIAVDANGVTTTAFFKPGP